MEAIKRRYTEVEGPGLIPLRPQPPAVPRWRALRLAVLATTAIPARTRTSISRAQ